MWKFAVLLLCLSGYCLAGPAGLKRNMPIGQQKYDAAPMAEAEPAASVDPSEMTIISTLTLPSNASSIRADITDGFSCENKTYGYYADVDNDCQIFHVCLPVTYADGKENTFRWSFICPEETIFSQDSFTCMRPDDMVITCEESYQYYELNRNFGSVEPTEEKETNNEAASENAENNETILEESEAAKPVVQKEEEKVVSQPIGQSKPMKVQKPARRKPSVSYATQKKPATTYPLRKSQTQPEMPQTPAVLVFEDLNEIVKPVQEEELKPTVQKFSRRPVPVMSNTFKNKIQSSKPEGAIGTRTELFNQNRKRPTMFNKKPVETQEKVKEEKVKTEAEVEQQNFSPIESDMSNTNTETQVADSEIEASETNHVFVKPEEVNANESEIINIAADPEKIEEPVKVLEAFEEIPAVISEVVETPTAEKQETKNDVIMPAFSVEKAEDAKQSEGVEEVQAAEEIQLPEENQTADETQAAEETQTADETQTPEVYQNLRTSAEVTQNAEEFRVAEEVAEESKVAEETADVEEAQTETKASEETQASGEPQAAEGTQSVEEVQAAEEIQSSEAAKETQVAAVETQAAEETQAVYEKQAAETQVVEEVQTAEKVPTPEEIEAVEESQVAEEAQSAEETKKEDKAPVAEEAQSVDETQKAETVEKSQDNEPIFAVQTQAVEQPTKETLFIEEPQPIKVVASMEDAQSVEKSEISEPAIFEENSEEGANVASVQTIEEMESEKPAEAPESMQATEEMSHPNAIVQQMYEDMDVNKQSIGGFKPVDPVMAHEAEQLIVDFINALRKNDFTNETPGMHIEHHINELAEQEQSLENAAVEQEVEKVESNEVSQEEVEIVKEEEKTDDAEKNQPEITETLADSVENNAVEVQEADEADEPKQETETVAEENSETNDFDAFKSLETQSVERIEDSQKSEEAVVETMNMPQEMYQIPVQVVTTSEEDVPMQQVQSQESEIEPVEMTDNTENKVEEETPAMVMGGYKPLSIDDIVELVKERLDHMPQNEMETPMQLEQVIGGPHEDKAAEVKVEEQLPAQVEEQQQTSQSEEEIVMPIYQRLVQPVKVDAAAQTEEVEQVVKSEQTEVSDDVKEKSSRSHRSRTLDPRKRRFLFKAESS